MTAKKLSIDNLFFSALLVIILGFTAFFAHGLKQGYDQRLRHAATEAENITRILEQHINAVVEKTDIAILGTSEELRHHHTLENPEKFWPRLTSFWKNFPKMPGLMVLTADGHSLADFPGDQTGNHGDRSYFTRQRDQPSLGLFISEPLQDAALTKWVIVLSRRLNNPAGSFLGVVAAPISLSSLEKFFGSLDLGRNSNIALVSSDFQVVAGFPLKEGRHLKSLKNGPLAIATRTNPRQGSFSGKSTVDGVVRVYHYRRVGDLPFLIVVGLARQEILSAWRRQALVNGACLAALLLAIGLLTCYVLRQSDRERRSLARLREITSTLGEGVYVLDKDGLITFVNPEAELILGWTAAELLGKNGHKVFHYKRPDGTPLSFRDCPVHQTISTGRTFHSLNEWLIHRDGSLVPVSLVSSAIFRKGKITGSVAAFQDISSRLEQEKALHESEERFRLLFDNANDAILVRRLEADGEPGKFIEANQVASQMLGYSREEFLEMTSAYLDDPDRAVDTPESGDRCLATGHAVFETSLRARDGGKIPVEISAHTFELQGHKCCLAIVRDISERKQAEEKIRRLVDLDTLTSLPNRRLLRDRLNQALFQAKRHQRPLAVMFLDLDHFKQINDTLGHDIGDELLQVVAARLTACVRSIDTVARLGGDEFVIVLTEIRDTPDAEQVARKISRSLKEPLHIREHELRVTTSIGIAIYPVNGDHDALKLMKMADLAMYETKAAGRDGYRIYREANG